MQAIAIDIFKNYANFIVIALAAAVFGAVASEVLSKIENNSSNPSDYLFVGCIAVISLVGLIIISSRL
jgi:hypothetical protein